MLLCNFIIQLKFKRYSSKLANEFTNFPEIYLKNYIVNGNFRIKKQKIFIRVFTSLYFREPETPS